MDNWYVWSYLIPPHTAARNITGRHFKIMESYISAPQIHASAVRNPKMAGGPFIDYGGKRVNEIKALYEKTKRTRGHLLELSAAFDALDQILATTTGFALTPLYDQIPAPLRGYVELVYDLHNHASARIVEPLLYRSNFFDRSAFSLALSITAGDDRPFVLSTPRLPDENVFQMPTGFESEVVDELFRLKRSPQPWTQIKERLNIPDTSDKLCRTFFTPQPPKPYESYTGDGVRWRYFGHACILIETNGRSFLFDPALSYTYESSISRYTYDDLPERIDAVLITHNHQDHILFETMLQLRTRTDTIIVPRSASGTLQDPSLKYLLQAVGFKRVVEIGELESFNMEGCEITSLPFFGEHCDLDIRTKSAYLLRLGRHKLLFAADSCNIEPKLYERVHSLVGDVDALFVGMECDGAPLTWLYGPLLTNRIERAMDESRRLAGSNYEQAIDIVDRFHCKEVYVYAMGQEPWLNHIMSLKYTAESRPITESNRLVEECRNRGICSERLFGEKEILLPA
jgi:L-ascorbate metabolism protein UlaG (beta-lactamase superfamily)